MDSEFCRDWHIGGTIESKIYRDQHTERTIDLVAYHDGHIERTMVGPFCEWRGDAKVWEQQKSRFLLCNE